jgi:hypothetical protein
MKNKFNAPPGYDVKIFTDWCESEIAEGGTFDPYNRYNFQDALEDYDFADVIAAAKSGDMALAGHLLNCQVLNYAMGSVRRAAIMDGIGYESD